MKQLYSSYMMLALKHSLNWDLYVLFNGHKIFQFTSEHCVLLYLQDGYSCVRNLKAVFHLF